ncbi:hypothetical protein Nazgul19 [Burkholderia phage BcepNazgul]|uniref:Uncharacterized protein n=1 Tax=Burkholderia phage BcepNazgul TaxID=242861 RepID=Q6UYE6_9CAUD|nr:hypothetical protein Nazgul19 [Burkholderia phage BcepNazgul]AAQ63395.2 hypothetical protein Nazgul19 [Burkholderia phage BcepNazgul]
MSNHFVPKLRVKKQSNGAVRVTVDVKMLEAGGHEILWNCAVMQRMRESGVPIMGLISIQGVRHGCLVQTYDECFMEHVYEWTPGPDSPKEVDPAAGL